MQLTYASSTVVASGGGGGVSGFSYGGSASGGIHNTGTLHLAGNTRVTGNVAAGGGGSGMLYRFQRGGSAYGGLFNDGGIVTMDASASITGNKAAAGQTIDMSGFHTPSYVASAVNDAGGTGMVVLNGIAQVGQAITATLTDFDGVSTSDLFPLIFTWKAGDTTLATSTVSADGIHASDSLVLPAAAAGQILTVQASYTDRSGNAESPVIRGLFVPGIATASIASLSVDTGVSSTDFITNVASQSVTVTLSDALPTAAKAQVSADGSTWVNATVDPTDTSGKTWVASGVTLQAGTGQQLQARIDYGTGQVTNSLATQGYTLDQTAPALVSFTPANGASVPVGANLVLTFSEPMRPGSGSLTVGNASGDSRSIAVDDANQVSFSADGMTVTINPTADLQQLSTYQIGIGAGAFTDVAGNASADIAWSFETHRPSYLITTSADPAAGSVSCDPNPVSHGTDSTCTAVPNAGHTTQSISGCGGTATGAGVASYVTGTITATCTVTATFAALPAVVTSVPTLGDWGLTLLGLLAAGLGALGVRRRRG